MPGPVLGTGDDTVNTAGTAPDSWTLTALWALQALINNQIK